MGSSYSSPPSWDAGRRAAAAMAEDFRLHFGITVLSADLFDYLRRRWHLLAPLAHTIHNAQEKPMTTPTRPAGLEATEAECAAGRTAPRVSLADIEGAIEAKVFATGEEIARGALAPITNEQRSKLGILTVCLLVMQNGFTIIGKSAPASPENYDKALGEKLAYEDAVRQLWPLMGYALRDRLSAG